jgi:hypothetical protein
MNKPWVAGAEEVPDPSGFAAAAGISTEKLAGSPRELASDRRTEPPP